MNTTSTAHSPHLGTLSSMPIEIKEKIAYWVHHLPSIQERYPKQTTGVNHGDDGDDDWDLQGLRKLYKSHSLPLNNIRSLALVDHLFSEICCTHIFEDLNFKGLKVDRVNHIFDTIMKKHSNHVRRIQWKVPKETPKLSLKPISQLTSLTHLCLTSSFMDNYSYTESFIVDLISNLSQLQGFTCSRIVATHPNPWDDTKDGPASHSPLGTHLALLTHLTELELEDVQCIDASWNQLKWKSSLHALSIMDCERVSAQVLHGLTKLFKSTLKTLIFHNINLHNRPTLNSQSILQDIKNDKFRFELPSLNTLEICSCLPLQFLKAFRHSEHLSWLLLSDNAFYQNRDLGDIIQLQLWPDLKKFEIKNGSPFLSEREINNLKVLCQQYGIELVVDSDIYFDEDEVVEYEEW